MERVTRKSQREGNREDRITKGLKKEKLRETRNEHGVISD